MSDHCTTFTTVTFKCHFLVMEYFFSGAVTALLLKMEGSGYFVHLSICPSIPPPKAHSVCAACLSLSLSSRVALLPWPSRLTAQSLQPLLTLHRPLHKWSHSSHLMSSDKCAALSNAVQHPHPPDFTEYCMTELQIKAIYFMVNVWSRTWLRDF